MKEVSASESIQLTRVHALGWYGFCDSFDLAGQTVITGVYGCGKTGFVDLIQTVLLGPPEHESRYNLSLADIGSSGRNEKRDLRGYCLQDLNLVDRGQPIYARGSSRTYIALEFTWPDRQRRETWGLRIEYTSVGADVDIAYWKMPMRLEFEDFLGGNEVPKSAEEWESVLHQRHERAFPSKAEYLDTMCAGQHLNFNRHVFKPLLLQTLQFKFGRDFTEFCRSNILPDAPVQLEEARGGYDRYRSLVAKMQVLREQKEVLEHIQANFEKQKKIRGEIDALEWFKEKHRVSEAEAAWKTAAARWTELCVAAEAWQKRHEELTRQREEAEQRLATDRKSMRAMPNAGEFEDLKKRQHVLPREIEELRTALEDPVGAFREKFERARRLSMAGREASRQHGWAEPPSFPAFSVELPERIDSDTLHHHLNELLEVVDTLASHYDRFARPVEGEAQRLGSGLITLRSEIARIREAKTAESMPLHEALIARMGARDVQLLGDLCTVLDEEWTDALEINFGHKFSSVVADDRIREAFGIFNGLPRTDARERLMCRDDMWKLSAPVRSGSLAEKITSDDPAVRQLLAYLFGAVICCRTVEEAEAHPRSILPSGAVKQPTGRRRLQAVPTEYLIGESGRQRTLARKEQEKAALERELAATEQRAKAARTSADGFHSIKLGLLRLSSNKLQLLRSQERKKQEQDDTSRRLDLFDNREQLEALRSGIIGRERALDGAVLAIRDHTQKQPADALEAKDRMEAAKKTYDEADSAWTRWQYDHPGGYDLASRHLHLEAEIACGTTSMRPSSTVCELLASDRRTIMAETRGTLRADRLKLKHDARSSEYRDADENDFGDNTFFDKKLAYIRDTGLDELTDQATRAELEWEDRFQNQVLGQLQHRFREIDETFRGLRRITSGRLIGGASYDFIYKAVNEAHFDRMRQLAVNREMDNMLPVGSPEHAEVKQARRAAMDALTVPASDAGDDPARLRAAAVRARELLDARYYFTYNMEIGEPDRTEKISLAHRGRKGSGGETYNPYFIALTAAYLRAFHRHVNRGRPSISLLLMDEAFKVLNSEAVRDCVKIIGELGLQGVISCTDTNGGQIVEFFQWIMIVQKRVIPGAAADGHDLIENSILSAARNDPEINRILLEPLPNAAA